MQRRVRTARLITIACGLAVAGSLIPRGGWGVIALAAVMLAIVIAGGMHLERRRRPELWVFVSTVLAIQCAVALGAVLSGGPRTPMSALLAAPVLMVGARFSIRGLLVGTPISLGLVLAATVGVDPGYVWQHPDSMIVPISAVIVTAGYLAPLMASDVRHRADSALDPLTGLLNRRSLETRLAEVAEQAARGQQPVSVVAVDVDHLKELNDEYGHASGDAALQEIADRLRENLRTFDLLYRVGGDEFLLLLPGASVQVAQRIAETLRKAVASAPPRGTSLTCSFGIAAAEGGIDTQTLAAQADIALYRAKRHGRNRVELEEVEHAVLAGLP